MPKLSMTSVPEPISFNLKRTRTDIFSAFMRARKEFGGATVAIVDGDERELTYTEIARAAFALGSIIIVACFLSQHSPMFGQPASSQTVTRPFDFTI